MSEQTPDRPDLTDEGVDDTPGDERAEDLEDVADIEGAEGVEQGGDDEAVVGADPDAADADELEDELEEDAGPEWDEQPAEDGNREAPGESGESTAPETDAPAAAAPEQTPEDEPTGAPGGDEHANEPAADDHAADDHDPGEALPSAEAEGHVENVEHVEPEEAAGSAVSAEPSAEPPILPVAEEDPPAREELEEPEGPAATEATAASAATSGWRRLGAALRPRSSRSQVLAGVLCAALGFALVVQVQQSASDQLSSARQEDLVRLLDEVTDRAQQLGDEVSGLEATRDELESGTGQARSALELAQQRAESEGILSGRLPAQGPGVRITIQDPGGALKASQMFNVLEELRNAGAEVVELNGVRLVTSTWFEDEGGAIVVDGTTLASPYEWTVIGDPETMDRALEIPGGALATVRTAGAEASTTLQDEVTITAVRPPKEPEHAQPQREDG